MLAEQYLFVKDKKKKVRCEDLKKLSSQATTFLAATGRNYISYLVHKIPNSLCPDWSYNGPLICATCVKKQQLSLAMIPTANCKSHLHIFHIHLFSHFIALDRK
jgi:hypothetical protein